MLQSCLENLAIARILSMFEIVQNASTREEQTIALLKALRFAGAKGCPASGTQRFGGFDL